MTPGFANTTTTVNAGIFSANETCSINTMMIIKVTVTKMYAIRAIQLQNTLFLSRRNMMQK
ncbi:MAG: hypothetical protein ACOX0Z_02400 [Candidatus Nanosyncoccaceae bacterium]